MTFDKFVDRVRMTIGHDQKDHRPFFIIDNIYKCKISISEEGHVMLTEYDIPSSGTTRFYWDENAVDEHKCMTFRSWFDHVIRPKHIPILEKFLFELTM